VHTVAKALNTFGRKIMSSDANTGRISVANLKLLILIGLW
jgi:hypothetical protein